MQDLKAVHPVARGLGERGEIARLQHGGPQVEAMLGGLRGPVKRIRLVRYGAGKQIDGLDQPTIFRSDVSHSAKGLVRFLKRVKQRLLSIARKASSYPSSPVLESKKT